MVPERSAVQSRPAGNLAWPRQPAAARRRSARSAAASPSARVAAAAATGGIGEGRSIGESALRGAIFGGVSAAIAVTVLGLIRMRRRKKA